MSDTEKQYSAVRLTLDNVLLSDDRLTPTPSAVDGLDANVETDLRILGCEMIQTAGILLKLPQVAMASGQVVFQRFYYAKSFVKHNFEVVAMACVNLAAKIEESPRRLRDVLNVFHHIKQMRNRVGATVAPLILDGKYIDMKSQVIKAERRILKELGFCVHVKHPHKIIVMYLRTLACQNNLKLVQTAWNFMNDSLRTNVFVRFDPETIACACIYLAARQMQVPLPNNPSWFLIFRVGEDDIKDVCLTILRVYTRPKPDFKQLETEVASVKQILMDAKLKAKGGVPSLAHTPSGSTHGSPHMFGSPGHDIPPLKKSRRDKSPDPVRRENSGSRDGIRRSLTPYDLTRESRSAPASPRDMSPQRDSNGRGRDSSSPPPARGRRRTPPRGYRVERTPSPHREARAKRDKYDRLPVDNYESSRYREKERPKRRRSLSAASPPPRSFTPPPPTHKRNKDRHRSRSKSRERKHKRKHKQSNGRNHRSAVSPPRERYSRR